MQNKFPTDIFPEVDMVYVAFCNFVSTKVSTKIF